MELSLEEVLDVVLEILSASVAVAMMYFFMNARAIITILERMI